MPSSSPSQPDPRRSRAACVLSGSAASVFSAKFTASRFVARRYRSITMRQASSSMSMLVRAIHQRYTAGSRVAGDGLQLVDRVEHGQLALVLSDHPLDRHDGAGADATDAAPGEEPDGEPAGLVDEDDLERRAV